MPTVNSRASKQIGDFGEGLVTYALIRQGFEIAHVDHVGADLIAQKGEVRLAISVKTRTFKEGSTESRGTTISFDHVDKLRHFSARFGLISAIAIVVYCVDDKKVHLFQATLDKFENATKKVKHGYYFNFGGSHLDALIESADVDYCCWDEAVVGPGVF